MPAKKKSIKKKIDKSPKPDSDICLAVAGGGCKALYGLGVGYKLRTWGIKIKEISGVSAGAAITLGIISEREEEIIEYFSELTRRNDSNFQVSRIFKGKSPFPHENIYRRIIRYGMDIDKIRKSKIKVRILSVKALPKDKTLNNYWNLAKLIRDTSRAYLQDDEDKSNGIPCNRVSTIMQRWNMEEIIYENKDLEDPDVIEEIIFNSSSIPPVLSFNRKKHDNHYYLDGGLTNNLLLEKFPDKYKRIGVYYEDTTIFGKDRTLLENTFLIKPSRKLPITAFDYTNPEGVVECYELGKSDAEKMKSKILEYCSKDYRKK